MNKLIVLSFDDGRRDTYLNAIQVAKKYNLPLTINITSNFIETPELYSQFASGANLAMTVGQVLESQQMGNEIACHGHTHCNTTEDVIKNIEVLKKWGVDTTGIGFASPYSALTEDGVGPFADMLGNEISYIRSGRQVRREGLFYSFKYFVQQTIHSSFLFYDVNRKAIIRSKQQIPFYYGISITRYTTLNQLKYFIDKMPDDSGAIFIFHSILSSNDPGYGADKWYWKKEDFDSLCKFLMNNNQTTVVTNKQLNERFCNVFN